MSLDMDIDLLGTQPALFKLYTQLAFVFASKATSSEVERTAILSRGLEHLCESFPWVAGQVIDARSDSKHHPKYKIRPCKSPSRLIVKYYEDDPSIPSFSEMADAKFPMRMMGEDLWAPCPTIASLGFDPTMSSGDADVPAPVLLVQLSIIRGGLILCINMQHNTCDMMGQAAVMGWLSTACSGKDFTEDELSLGNMGRRGVVPLLEEVDWDPRIELKHQLLPAQDTRPKASRPNPHCSWIYVNFNSTSLATLKELATSELPTHFNGYISTDDALCAFIFKSIIRARQSRLPTDLTVNFARAVDARRYLSIHPQYPGILQNMAYTTCPLSELLATPLGHTAATMRQQVDPKTSDIARRTRALVTFMAQAADNAAKTSPTATMNTEADVILSSWGKVPAYEWDFGLGLGAAKAVRRPGFVPVESLMYTMPMDGDGAVTVAMCLREEDVQQLRIDREWQEFVVELG